MANGDGKASTELMGQVGRQPVPTQNVCNKGPIIDRNTITMVSSLRGRYPSFPQAFGRRCNEAPPLCVRVGPWSRCNFEWTPGGLSFKTAGMEATESISSFVFRCGSQPAKIRALKIRIDLKFDRSISKLDSGIGVYLGARNVGEMSERRRSGVNE